MDLEYWKIMASFVLNRKYIERGGRVKWQNSDGGKYSDYGCYRFKLYINDLDNAKQKEVLKKLGEISPSISEIKSYAWRGEVPRYHTRKCARIIIFVKGFCGDRCKDRLEFAGKISKLLDVSIISMYNGKCDGLALLSESWYKDLIGQYMEYKDSEKCTDDEKKTISDWLDSIDVCV